ncbi:Uncharacterised protein [Mycobacteroides abscessus subsp. abscessus]|nr:Uncharacterised protein [Mycobacteroides abscessus subsp. abscessus]SKY56364.1 Uncharacterised protein [Mycobacteroides abscessus subsp. abscessus]
MLLGTHPADAGCRTLLDIPEQAGSINLLVALEYSVRAGARREHPGQQVERFPDGPRMRVGPEVAHALATWAAIDEQPRIFFIEGDREHRIRLVVAIADVETRIEFLDPVVFELQGLDLGAHHRPLHAAGSGDHLPGARMQTRDVGEIGGESAAQALGLADVDDPAMRIAESVDTRLDGDRAGSRSIGRGIGHMSRLVRGSDDRPHRQ